MRVGNCFPSNKQLSSKQVFASWCISTHIRCYMRLPKSSTSCQPEERLVVGALLFRSNSTKAVLQSSVTLSRAVVWHMECLPFASFLRQHLRSFVCRLAWPELDAHAFLRQAHEKEPLWLVRLTRLEPKDGASFISSVSTETFVFHLFSVRLLLCKFSALGKLQPQQVSTLVIILKVFLHFLK